ncbi:MAG: MFS transporter [Parcubacteria group bacterium]|nr:MFS transporter [Parcubacteria group bacterium]
MQRFFSAKSAPLYPLYLALFFFSFQLGLTLYITSSFLKNFLPESFVGFVYIAASVASLFALLYTPKVLPTLGNYQTTLALLGLEFFALVAIALWPESPAVIPLFIIYQGFVTISLFNIDIFIERYSEERITGSLRGIMLTVLNIAILLGPLVAGLILTNGDFWKVYLVAAFFTLPTWWIIARHFRNFKDPVYSDISLFVALKKVLFTKHPKDDIRHAGVASFLMNFFYSWMVIYTPLYLHDYIGFSWSEIGVILTIMLLPFVLFEIPVGRYADVRSAERKVMFFGFLIAAFFTGALALLKEPSLFVWAFFLFGTRVGMSFIEITSESYFFKRVKATDTSVISIFRDMRPISSIAGPLSASILLLFFDVRILFFALAGILLLGALNAALMRDARALSPVEN